MQAIDGHTITHVILGTMACFGLALAGVVVLFRWMTG